MDDLVEVFEFGMVCGVVLDVIEYEDQFFVYFDFKFQFLVFQVLFDMFNVVFNFYIVGWFYEVEEGYVCILVDKIIIIFLVFKFVN